MPLLRRFRHFRGPEDEDDLFDSAFPPAGFQDDAPAAGLGILCVEDEGGVAIFAPLGKGKQRRRWLRKHFYQRRLNRIRSNRSRIPRSAFVVRMRNVQKGMRPDEEWLMLSRKKKRKKQHKKQGNPPAEHTQQNRTGAPDSRAETARVMLGLREK
ncbi:hypothetical protein HY491_02275 [Candidatus Woesearchaeota archaeon]|nr:hypothetical protein [Candidatus Woesearchaeota archaeon]